MKYLAEFNGYKLREVNESDYDQLDQWIAADKYHASIFEPDFFLGREVNEQGVVAPDPHATCYAMEDSMGEVFYIRLSRAARVHIQFPPASELLRERRRIANGLLQGMAFLEVALGRAGCEEWIFASESPQLRHLAENSLGFEESKNELVKPMLRKEVSDVRRS